jgi:hypothetical protein
VRAVLGFIADGSRVTPLLLISLGVSAIDSEGYTIWIADAHRDDGKRFVVRADEKLTAFIELETVIRTSGELV